MRILLTHRPGGAYGFISEGWHHAFRDKGHVVLRWDGNQATWRDFKPDIYIGCSGHKQPIPSDKHCKIAIHVNPYGPVDLGPINETTDNIAWTLKMKPHVVFGYGAEDDRILWSNWERRHNIRWCPMPTAGDAVLYKKLDNVQRQHDFVYLGGRWPYKAQNIDSYLLPLCQAGFNYKIRGWGEWPNGVCSGPLNDDEVVLFLNSGKVGPCISEPHTHEYGIDIPERVFKVILCGALAIHDGVPAVRKLLPSAVIATTPESFLQQCRYFSNQKNAEERATLWKRQLSEVLHSHTYHHRLAGLLRVLGFPTEAEKML